MNYTNAEFYQLADIWYQRFHNLRRIWEEKNIPIEKRTKAFRLWIIMLGRLLKVNEMAIKINHINMNKCKQPQP